MILAPKYKFKPSGTPKIIVPSLRNNLIGQWLFNEGSGNTVFDLSRKGNKGTLTGTAPSWTTGKFGSAVNFPGTDEYISITNEHNFDFERTDLFSISLWVSMDANEGTAICSKAEVAGNERGWILWQVQGASTPTFQLQMQSTGGNLITVNTNNEYLLNTWHHVVVTYNGSSAAAGVNIYVNGILDRVSGNDSLSATILNSIPFQFSGIEGGNVSFDGKIDNASIYNRELTAFEAALLYQNSFRMFGHVINPRLVHLVTVPTTGVTHQVEGSISTETTVSGNLSHTQNLLAGNINEPETTVSGNLSQTSNIAGSIDKPETSVSGNLSQTSNVAGSISTETTVSGALTVTKIGIPVEGSISTETTVSGSILINGITVEPTGNISVQTELSGGITISQWRKFALELEDVEFNDIITKGPWVDVRAYGAVGDGVTDDTAAINTANDTGKDLYFPEGTYMTTGLHRISTTGQIWRGAGKDKTIIKKLSGTNYLLDTTHGVNFPQLRDMTFDGNSLGGSAVIWRAHYSKVSNLVFKNQGGTSYALHVSGTNLSHFQNLMTWPANCYGGILIDQSVDSYSPTPSYGCLYSVFDNISIGQTDGGSALKIAGSSAQILTFNNFYFEETQAAVPAIDISGNHCANITFNNLRSESQTLSESLIKVDASGTNTSYNIRFIGGRFSCGVAQTNLIFELESVDGLTIEDILFYDAYSAAGRNIVQITDIKNGKFTGNTFSYENNFDFITGISGNEHITVKNNATRDATDHTGVGTNLWNGTDNLTIENSELTQNLGTATNVVINTGGKIGVGIDPKTLLTIEGTLTLKEQAAADTDTAGYGQIWVKTATPNELWFTDDAGTDTQIV